MTSQTSMWNLGKVRSSAKGGKFLSLEPLFWQSKASLEIPWEPRAFSEGQRSSMSFATDERTRLFWERAETDLIEQLAAAPERVFKAKLTPEAVRQRPQVPAVSPQPHSARLPSCAARVFCLSAAPGTSRFALSSFRKTSCAKPARRWGTPAPAPRTTSAAPRAPPAALGSWCPASACSTAPGC